MRKPNGRKKIEIAKIQNQTNLQVTFSKRRAGLFKKASELSTLCGSNVAIVAFSPSNKVYACGHPSVESIVDKFVRENPPPETDDPNPIIVAHQNANIDELNKKMNKLERSLERERKHGQALQALRTEPSNEKLSFFDLKILCESLEAADKNVEKLASQFMECGIEFPYKTIGIALAPLRARESTSSVFGEGSSGSGE
ncbi:agamous-like MADS-box protein AGL62 [Solanum lycopersicum]|uniref:MADS-box domain-containing protein n=1 Tax=Solanum lycopersicum TaxID=4081 RepID=A0A3Q7EEM1_SOLLC|nr:agamous-like MADS-box protein AGL62 [Solanum lycopersicum]